MFLGLNKNELHTWVAAVVAVIGSLGWLYESAVKLYGSEATLEAHQGDFKEQLVQQREDIRALQFQLANCRGKHEE